MIALLFLLPPRQMMEITACTALLMVAICGGKVVEGAATHLLAVLLVMSATQLAVRRVLEAGAGASLTRRCSASLASHRLFRRTPAALLVPVLFVPATWVLAAVLHNVTAIAIVVPLLSRIAKRFGVDPRTTLCALLVSSNLEGQPRLWRRPRDHAAGDLGLQSSCLRRRHAAAQCDSGYSADGADGMADLVAAQDANARLGRSLSPPESARRHRAGRRFRERAINLWPAIYAGIVLIAFIALQFVFPTSGLSIAACALLALIMATPEQERGDALMVLGLEPVVVVASLFAIAATVQRTPLFGSLAAIVNQSGVGRIEAVSYIMALTISADGAAAALVRAIHDGSQGSLLSAWQLACGICAGSSAMLTSASAGPILYALAKLNGNEISFRRYAAFGVPFSFVMLVVSFIYNTLAGGVR